jgi:YihY family inner membrane protein
MRDSTSKTSARIRRGLSRFWHKAYADGLTGLAGMVAYNLLLSLLPLTLLALFIFGQIVHAPDVEASVIRDVQRILPATSEGTITRLLREINRSSTEIGIAAVLASVWIGASFWGALDTAFCRIYHTAECRTWWQQKRFAMLMLVVVLVLFVATVGLPAAQGAVTQGAEDLPFGLDASTVVYAITLAGTVAALFAALVVIYKAVPNDKVPWTAVWPGALIATVAMAIVDYSWPIYLQGNVLSTFGGTYVFILLVLLWFYAVALIMLAGAVVNAPRLERHQQATVRANVRDATT